MVEIVEEGCSYNRRLCIKLSSAEESRVKDVLVDLIVNYQETMLPIYQSMQNKPEFHPFLEEAAKFCKSYKLSWRNICEFSNADVAPYLRFQDPRYVNGNVHVNFAKFQDLCTTLTCMIIIHEEFITPEQCTSLMEWWSNKGFISRWRADIQEVFLVKWNLYNGPLIRKKAKDYVKKLEEEYKAPHVQMTGMSLLLSYTDWTELSKNPQIVEDEYLLDNYTSWLNWRYISRNDLSDRFIEKFKEKIDWSVVSRKGLKISNEMAQKYASRINWKNVSKTRLKKLPKEFLFELQLKGLT